MIRFQAVTKQFADGTVAVDELDLEVPAGQICVLVGPSGCGKTTTLRMINGMVTPTSGRVLVDGRDVATEDPTRLRRHIGYVIQHAGLFPHRTVLDNIGTVPRLLGSSRRQARHRSLELMELVGLPTTLADRYPAQLSGGQRQRVGVARALAADPPVMLMDEPFSAVDPVVRAQLQTEFLRLQGELGTTIAFVTHDVDEAIQLGHQLAIFRQGGVLAQVGTPEQILTHPANAFVEEFVGKDRGWRSLSFVGADQVPAAPVASVTGAAPGRPRLVLDALGRPERWELAGGTTVAPAVVTATDSARTVADLSISHPSGFAVLIDEHGMATAVADHAGVVELVAARKQAEYAGTTEPAGAPRSDGLPDRDRPAR